ncbi:MAG: YicC family protein [Candidatus Marinimicrobia bacterium]|nr:YicC family protein [Candidatus Neomarinimicrobiota bacterium]
MHKAVEQQRGAAGRTAGPQSMTGFGRGQARAGEWQVTVELQSVNRRQLDIQFSPGAGLVALEGRIQAMIAGVVRRGRVQGSLAVLRRGGALEAPVFDAGRATELLAHARQWAARAGRTAPLDPACILALPGVVRAETIRPDPEALWPLIEQALTRALRGLARSRRLEGRRLAADLGARLDGLQTLVETVTTAAPRLCARFPAALAARMQAAAAPGLPDERLLREVGLFADRADISEELERLRTHLVHARRILRRDAEAGRTLDFYAQELLREINTIGAKANDGAIARSVVAFKTELERWREQVQNLQ